MKLSVYGGGHYAHIGILCSQKAYFGNWQVILLLIACFILLERVMFDNTENTLSPCKLQTAQVFLASTKSVMDLWPILVYNKNILSFV